ncbi:glycosyltransferase, partial [Helicobacter pylori]|nr:glycosyltransferase [Helicobacter pylori]
MPEYDQIQSTSKLQPKVIAIIPAHNEARFIAGVVLETRRYVSEVIVVDDGSTDRTAQLAQAAGATVIRQPRNMGKAEALNAGFRAARELNPD